MFYQIGKIRYLKGLSLSLAFLLCSCVNQVTTITQDGAMPLEKKTGFLLVAVDTNYSLNTIQMTGKSTIELTSSDLKRGTSYILTPIPAGNYTVKKIELDDFYHVKLKSNIWDFDVRPNAISYIGHLDVHQSGVLWNSSVSVEFINKSSEALEFLEEGFPQLLTHYEINYNGPGDDNFFELVRQYQSRSKDDD